MFKIVNESKNHSLEFLDIYGVSNNTVCKYQNIDIKYLELRIKNNSGSTSLQVVSIKTHINGEVKTELVQGVSEVSRKLNC